MATYRPTTDGKAADTVETSEVADPAAGEIIGYCPVAGAEEVDAAVEAARAAFTIWRIVGDSDRSKACRALAARLENPAAVEKARARAARLECGTAWINRHRAIRPDVPFGGVEASGLGVEFGREGLEECTDIRVITQ